MFVNADHDDTGLICLLAAGDRRVDRHHDANKLGSRLNAQLVELGVLPQGAKHVV